MSPEKGITPRTFYLNEQHELARAEREGGGRIPRFTGIDWAGKGSAINKSLDSLKRQLQKSSDPTKDSHYFVLAAPVQSVSKLSKSKRKPDDVEVIEKTNFARKHSQVFRRLGMDLIAVSKDGSAVVHMKPEVMDQLSTRARTLDALGAKEQSRWATIGRFDLIPDEFRIDGDWLNELRAKRLPMRSSNFSLCWFAAK